MTDNIKDKVAGTEEVQKGILKTRSHLILNVKGDSYSFPTEYNFECLRLYQGKHREAYAAIMSDGKRPEQRKELKDNYKAYCKAEVCRRKHLAERRAWAWWY